MITFLRPIRSDSMPKGNCNNPCDNPYAPSAMPTQKWSLPPGSVGAYRANTGNMRNMPSMRRPKIEARPMLARFSVGVSESGISKMVN